jgi:hypothetical protein
MSSIVRLAFQGSHPDLPVWSAVKPARRREEHQFCNKRVVR